MRGLESVGLDGRALSYVRQRLSEVGGYGPMCRQFCSRIDALVASAPGQVSALAPRGVAIERLYEFEAGGLLPENLDMSRAFDAGGGRLIEVVSLSDDIINWLRSGWSRDRSLVGIAVDPMPRRGDPNLEDYSRTGFYVGDELFHALTADTPEDAMELAVHAAPPWANVIVLGHYAPSIGGAEVSVEELSKCAPAVQSLAITAYDGESNLYWRRHGPGG